MALTFVIAACGSAAAPTPAKALVNPLKPICGAVGLANGLAGKACTVLQHGGRLLKGGKQLLSGHPGAAIKTVLGVGGGKAASTALGLAAIVTWVTGGAGFVLRETSKVLAETTRPQLASTWFSSTYWRMTGIAALLTLPFLFAAAVQALIRSDLTLIVRAAFFYLPLSMLAVGVAAPLTMLLLAASDEMSSIVSSAAGHESAHFLGLASGAIGALTLGAGSPFLALVVGLFVVAGTLVLWMELLMRAAAVYVIVLMLPLAFAAFVWPARRVWAVRAVELLVALILSKFAIVAVLSLGGAALSHSLGHARITGVLAGLVLIVMAAFAPWALLRLLPLAELASGAVGSLRGEARSVVPGVALAHGGASSAHDWAASTTSEMRRDADGAAPSDPAARVDQAATPDETSAGTNHSAATANREDNLGAVAPDGATPTPAAEADAQTATEAPAGQRIPGFDEMYQGKDLSWDELALGPGAGWPEPRVWQAEGSDGGTGDDPDPRPPAQEPDDGRL